MTVIYEGHLHEANLGGGRFHFLGVLDALSRVKNVSVIPILPKYKGVPFLRLPPTDQVIALSCGRWRGVIGAFRYEVKKVFTYLRLGLRVLTHRERPLLLTRLSYHGFSTGIARLVGLPVVVEINGDLLEEARQRKLGWLVEVSTSLLVNIQFKAAHAFVAVTPAIAASASDRRRPTLTLPNAAVIDDFPALEYTHGEESPRIAVFIGTLAPWYELELVLDAIAQLNSRNSEQWQLVVVGDGEGREALQSAVTHRRLDTAVRFRGWLPREELRNVLHGATLCLAPLRPKGDKRSSGSPLKLFEYLASNLPVVGSDVDGIAEIEHPLLFHYRQGEVKSLIEMMEKAQTAPRLAGEALTRWRRAVSWDERVEQLLAFLDEQGLKPSKL